jgi:uncharacterized membrane protein YcaP (DUF421 family)
MNWQHFLFEREESLTALQMAARAVLIFFITLILIRLGGVRIFGRRSAMDMIIVIVMGSILARGVVGSSDLRATVAASFAMIVIHHILAWISMRNKVAENIIKGQPTILYKDGNIIHKNLRKASLSENDLLESLHLETKKKSFEEIEIAILETDGRISFILKKNSTA